MWPIGAFQNGCYFFVAKKVTKKAPGFQQILRLLNTLRRRKKNSPIVANRPYGLCRFRWLEQFFASPASGRPPAGIC
jgi:hypothetical protein